LDLGVAVISLVFNSTFSASVTLTFPVLCPSPINETTYLDNNPTAKVCLWLLFDVDIGGTKNLKFSSS